MNDRPLRGSPPDPQDLEWLALMDEARKNAPKTLDEAAKQLIGIAPILSGLYAAALSFAKIRPEYFQTNDAARFLFTAPILLSLASLIAAVLSQFPLLRRVNPFDPDVSREAYENRIAARYRWLQTGMVFLILSIAALLLAVWTYLGVLASGNVVLSKD